jgi:ankyrin repeat protein
MNKLLKKTKEFINSGENIDKQDERGDTFLMDTIHRYGPDIKIVEEFIKAGANLNIQDERGQTILMHIIQTDSLEIVKMLLKAGADPNKQDHRGYTALLHTDTVEIIEELIKYKADVNKKNKEGRSAIMDIRDLKIFKIFIKAGANKNDIKKNKTLICKIKKLTDIEYLIKYGITLSKEVLYCTININNIVLFKYILKHFKMDFSENDNKLVKMAISNDKKEMIELLLKKKNVNVSDVRLFYENTKRVRMIQKMSKTSKKSLQKFFKFTNTLSQRKKDALEVYVESSVYINCYMDGVFDKICKRHKLSVEEISKISKITKDSIETITNIFKEAPKMTEPMIVFRGFDNTQHKSNEKGFTSASRSIDVASGFIHSYDIPGDDQEYTGNCCVYIVHLPPGDYSVLPLEYLFYAQEQEEVLLPPNGKIVSHAIYEAGINGETFTIHESNFIPDKTKMLKDKILKENIIKKKVSFGIKKLCKKHNIRLTTTRKNKRIPKSEKVLLKEIKRLS